MRQELLESRPSLLDRLTVSVLAVLVLLGLSCFLVHAQAPDGRSCALALLLVAIYVFGFTTEFRAATGGFVPTEPVLVAIMFGLPWQWGPATVLVAVLIGSASEEPRRARMHMYASRVLNALHCLGPMTVIAVSGQHDPHTVSVWVLLLALASQFALDTPAALLRGVVQGVPLRVVAKPLLWTFCMDALLAPIGFCIVATAQDRPEGYLLLIAPILLVRLMRDDRESHRRQAEQIKSAYSEVREQVHLDPLTGVLNRRGWDDEVEQVGAELVGIEQRSAVVIMADVDHLKPTNDTYGHDVGDVVLCEVAQVLQGLGPEDAVVARLGGDEFGVLWTVSAGYRAPDLVAQARGAMVAASNRLGHVVSASVGVAVCPPGGCLTDTIRRADQAAAADKAARRVNRYTQLI